MRPSIIPHDLTGKALYDFIVKNEGLIIHSKKSELKRADSITHHTMYIDSKGVLIQSKEEAFSTLQSSESKVLKAVLAINTTNWFDSHYDVHISGLWKKSISDNRNKGFYLLKNHNRTFEDVIAEGCIAETKTVAWSELGITANGTTEVLLFNALLNKERNEYMYGQYQKGYVKEHSVGMRYVKMLTCINDDDYPVQKENWDKYIEVVSNRADAEKAGFFFAIIEAKICEGSSVLFGSNSMTPTISIEEVTGSTKDEPLDSTHDEPQFDLLSAIKQTKFIN